jgi:hypothetical protein
MLRKSLILCGLLVCALAAGAYGQAIVYFHGKITEISKTAPMVPGETKTFLIIKLDTKPNMEFRISRENALKYGLIEAGASGFLTPKQLKGLGWKVKLTCSKEEKAFSGTPIYQVISLERVNH